VSGAAGLDLNLLVLLETLFVEGSVSKAARRLGVSQPAASKGLERLRRHFGDELFVRTPRGMRPTARALALGADLQRVLADLRRLVEEAPAFDPTTARGIVRVAMSDAAEFVLLPGLVERLGRLAPALDLRARPLDKARMSDALDRGELDAVVGVFPDLPKRFLHRALWFEQFVCLMRADHPLCTAQMTLEHFTRYPHVLVTLKDDAEGAVDRALAAVGAARRVAVTVGHFLVVPQILAQSECIATVASRFGRAFAASMGCRICPPPVEIPGWTEQLVWGQGTDRLPLQRWFRALVVETAQALEHPNRLQTI